MSEVLTVDAILFGLLVFSGILGNILVIDVVRKYIILSVERAECFEWD